MQCVSADKKDKANISDGHTYLYPVVGQHFDFCLKLSMWFRQLLAAKTVVDNSRINFSVSAAAIHKYADTRTIF